MTQSILAIGLAFAVAIALHSFLWWLRYRALWIMTVLGCVFFMSASSSLPEWNRYNTSSAAQIGTIIVILSLFVGPVLLGLYHSFWLETPWRKRGWYKAFFAVYAEIAVAYFAVESLSMIMVQNGLAPQNGSLFKIVCFLTLLLLAWFGPGSYTFFGLMIPLLREHKNPPNSL